jgi:hypothetical protein
VIATGKITTYAGSSKYQIVIESIEPAGAGALDGTDRRATAKACRGGAVRRARKQLLPFMPMVIGVVTSPTGAVIRDILHRIEDRFPVHVIVWPVRVQGDTSGNEVARAITGFKCARGRGGDQASGPDHCRTRRRQPWKTSGGSMMRQWCAPQRFGHSADLGGRARDRLDADRSRQRPARADADRRCGNGGAGQGGS